LVDAVKLPQAQINELLPESLVLGRSGLEFDEFQKLDLRVVLGGGFGWHILKTERTAFDFFGGLPRTILYDNGQASVKLNYEKMEPAVLFAGDISAFVLWAVTLDGSAENLGEAWPTRKAPRALCRAIRAKGSSP
jgi:hypothetical protein